MSKLDKFYNALKGFLPGDLKNIPEYAKCELTAKQYNTYEVIKPFILEATQLDKGDRILICNDDNDWLRIKVKNWNA